MTSEANELGADLVSPLGGAMIRDSVLAQANGGWGSCHAKTGQLIQLLAVGIVKADVSFLCPRQDVVFFFLVLFLFKKKKNDKYIFQLDCGLVARFLIIDSV